VPLGAAESARADWLERFPAGFEEREVDDALELAAYVEDVPEELRDAAVEDVPGDWLDRWRAFHHGVAVGPLWIGPPWEHSAPRLLPVVIDPGRAFGTGAHATTRLCLAWLSDLEPGSLVDIGCGSGVVAIAAARLGFAPVFAVDDDPAAVEATERNARANDVGIDVARVDALHEPLPSAAVAIANIALDVVVALAPRVTSRTLVTSGYYDNDLPTLDGYDHVDRRTAAGWAADRWQRRE